MKKIVKDPKKEKNILETSARLFGEKGYRETKTDQIAEEAGVSKGLLFHYYGNKGGLYQATYLYAADFFYQRVDYSVWTKATDLLEMVVDATKYKIQLQLEYPFEFGFLLRAYTEIPNLPEPLKETMNQQLAKDFQQNISLTDEVIAKLPIKDGLERNDVIETIYAVLNSETEKIQKVLVEHPEWHSIEDIMPLIDGIKRKLKILEFGFVKVDE